MKVYILSHRVTYFNEVTKMTTASYKQIWGVYKSKEKAIEAIKSYKKYDKEEPGIGFTYSIEEIDYYE